MGYDGALEGNQWCISEASVGLSALYQWGIRSGICGLLCWVPEWHQLVICKASFGNQSGISGVKLEYEWAAIVVLAGHSWVIRVGFLEGH